jgi:hypothetical protein
MTAAHLDDGWKSAWLDLAAFLLVLAIAWWTRASSTDLVWSLWLSSLVVGYTIILWAIFRLPLVVVAAACREPRSFFRGLSGNSTGSIALLAAIAVAGVSFTLAFFTVHFGGFHYVHAGFLSGFFPVVGKWDGRGTFGEHDLAMYREVVRRYWIYLPAAFLAERAVFLRPPAGSIMMLPYLKVVRMHVLIFFFGFAHFLRLDNFAVYVVVYAVYFFPWRLVKRSARSGVATQPASAVT